MQNGNRRSSKTTLRGIKNYRKVPTRRGRSQKQRSRTTRERKEATKENAWKKIEKSLTSRENLSRERETGSFFAKWNRGHFVERNHGLGSNWETGCLVGKRLRGASADNIPICVFPFHVFFQLSQGDPTIWNDLCAFLPFRSPGRQKAEPRTRSHRNRHVERTAWWNFSPAKAKNSALLEFRGFPPFALRLGLNYTMPYPYHTTLNRVSHF